MTSAIALAACFAAPGSADAQAIYAGGATLPSKVYRQLMDCWGVPVNTAIVPVSPSCPSASGGVGGIPAQIVYAPVGSGAGKRAFRNDDGSSSTSTGLGTPATTNTIPFTSTYLSAYGYPHFHFAGSDDIMTASDISAYNTAGGPAKFGKPLQVPAFISPVAIAINGKDGAGAALNITTPTPTGGTSGLRLSRNALCGIFSGHITKWNNPILTALNGGTPLGTGTITVQHRSDGSGTTFLTTNPLVAQCIQETGPNSETDATVVSYAFPWSDRGPAASTCVAPLPVRGANLINWPDLGTNQCGTAIANPGGGTFVGGSGNSSVRTNILATNGSIGYLSPDFAKPADSTGPVTANLQNQYELDAGSTVFLPPTAANAVTAMASAFPPSTSDDAELTNPLSWSSHGVVPNPLTKGSYPLAGFTWFELYQCYSDAANPDLTLSEQGLLSALFSYLSYHYADPSANAILNANGFAPIPSPWLDAVTALATTSSVKLSKAGAGSCVGITPGS